MNRFPMMLTRSMTVTALAILALAAAGCSAVDRAGGTAAAPVTTLRMTLESGEVPTQLQAWADLVEKDSAGSLKIEFLHDWRSGETDLETGTIADIKAGKVDLGWVGVRAFDLIGDTDFQALLAPMLVDSHDLQAKVFAEGIPERMLTGVSALGVRGVAVLPGPMRKVLGVTKPYRGPGDFRGAVVGMQNSALSRQSLEALGATTKAEPPGARLDGLDAYEQQFSLINGSGYVAESKYVTANLNLWPRPLAIIGNPKAIAALRDSQRAAIEKASASAVTAALDASRTEDKDGAAQLCRQGMQMVEASAAQLAALVKAEQPVYDQIATNSRAAGWLQRIRSIKSSLSRGPDTASCGTTSSRADELAGTWTTTVRTGDWKDAGFDGPEGKYTLTFADGQVTVTDPDGSVGYTAAYEPFRGVVVTTGREDRLRASYRVTGSQLMISDLSVNGVHGPSPYSVVWTTHPFTRQR